jgi:hypothetical protein
MASAQGRNIHEQRRLIIESVIRFCSGEKTEALRKPPDKASERAYARSQLSESSACEIRKQIHGTEEEVIQFSAPREAKISPNPQQNIN